MHIPLNTIRLPKTSFSKRRRGDDAAQIIDNFRRCREDGLVSPEIEPVAWVLRDKANKSLENDEVDDPSLSSSLTSPLPIHDEEPYLQAAHVPATSAPPLHGSTLLCTRQTSRRMPPCKGCWSVLPPLLQLGRRRAPDLWPLRFHIPPDTTTIALHPPTRPRSPTGSNSTLWKR